MTVKRTDRLNSLLREVLSEVIRKDVKNPHIHELLTITAVEISKDLQNAKVYISVIGTDSDKKTTVSALNSAAGYIAVVASKKVVMRYFPHLTFYIDNSAEKQDQINILLQQINTDKQLRKPEDDPQ
jgi:ribosome-binding factor A